MDEAPDIGGKANRMSGYLYMTLAVFAFCEADGRASTPGKGRIRNAVQGGAAVYAMPRMIAKQGFNR